MSFMSIKDLNEGFEKKYGAVAEPVGEAKKPKKSLKESYHTEPRYYTDKLMDLYDAGVDPELLILALAKYMSDDEVGECLRINDLYLEEEDEEVDECMNKPVREDTVKTSKGKWVNKGDTGETHGEFKTKKEADAQRRAMFARGFKK